MLWAPTMRCYWMNWRRRSSRSARSCQGKTANESSVLHAVALPVFRHIFRGARIELAGCSQLLLYSGESCGDDEAAVLSSLVVWAADGAGRYHSVSSAGILRAQLRLA